MKEAFAFAAIGAALATAAHVMIEDAPNLEYVLVGCTFSIVFALLANAARRSR